MRRIGRERLAPQGSRSAGPLSAAIERHRDVTVPGETRKVAVETRMFRATGRDRNSPPVWATQTRCRRERREEKELETKPTRLIGLIRVIDATAFDEYRGRVGATVEKFGGVIRQRGAMAGFLWNEIDCGGFDAFVELEFPSRETAERWAASDDYRNLLPLRSRAMQLALFAVE